MNKYRTRRHKKSNRRTKRKERKSKRRSYKRAGLPNTPYTPPANSRQPMSLDNPPTLAPGYVERVGAPGSDEHCTYITTPTGTYSHATVGTPSVRYHYGFRRFANGNVEGPYAWTNPARQPIPANIVNKLLDIYTHCSNQ
jgi:hypothetical protein